MSVLTVMLGFSFWKAAMMSSKAFFSVSPDQLTNVSVALASDPPDGACPPVLLPVNPAQEVNAPVAAKPRPACSI